MVWTQQKRIQHDAYTALFSMTGGMPGVKKGQGIDRLSKWRTEISNHPGSSESRGAVGSPGFKNGLDPRCRRGERQTDLWSKYSGCGCPAMNRPG